MRFLRSDFFYDVCVPLIPVIGLIVFFVTERTRPFSEEKIETNFKENVRKVEYEGHTYLIFRTDSMFGLCHDENCMCKRLCK